MRSTQRTQKFNLELVRALDQLVQQHPHLNFSQILINFGFVGRHYDSSYFYEESEDTLDRVRFSIDDYLESGYDTDL